YGWLLYLEMAVSEYKGWGKPSTFILSPDSSFLFY
ncbi:hypothetical protein AVDCRST_MAG94-2314, partial [uncultured Leptolyngbya sp.]